ncbi:MAG TPA: hypothetical protein GX707_17625 [Epulopiscium sp.]|nr:hypothetical protein [Candidatus Epulonipiscium sp.]
MKGLPNIRVYDPGQIGMGGKSNMVYLACKEQMDDGVMFRFLRHLEDDENLIYMLGTGLKDKNDIEIYEGDIIKRKHPLDGRMFINGEVARDKNTASFVINYVDFECMLYIDTDREIIGNVYENKELLAGRGNDNDL